MLILPFFFFSSLSLSLYGAPPFTFKGRKGQRPFFLLLFLFLFFLSIFLKFSSNTWCMTVPLFYWQRNLRMGIWIPVSLLFFFFFFSFGDHLSAFSASLYLLFFFFVMLLLLFRSFFNRHLFPQCSPILPALGVPMQDAGEKKKKCINRAVRDNDALCVFFFF